MKKERLEEILKEHKKWLDSDGNEGKRADLSSADLSSADLSCADLHSANLSCANLSCADLRCADLSCANLSCANLHSANLSCAYLSSADLSSADLSSADLSCADLRYADLKSADLRYTHVDNANFSGAKNLPNAIDFMTSHFEKTDEGYIVYKTFGSNFRANPDWEIKPNSIIQENVNHIRTQMGGCGINVAPLDYVKNHFSGTIYKLLIKLEWLSEVCVPYNSDGMIRCGRAMIIGEVEGE